MSVENNDDPQALINTIRSGPLEFVDLFLKRGDNPNAVDKNGRTALMYAAYYGHYEHVGVAKILIAAGANVNATDKNGFTALRFAAQLRHAEVAKVLLENGADPNIPAGDGKTPWDYIKGNKQMELIFNEALKEWYDKQ